MLRLDPSQDSDALFAIRLQLTKDGSYTADHVDWDKLAQSHPERFILLIGYLLMAYATSISRGENRRRPGRRTEIDWLTLEKVGPTVISRQYWLPTWEMLFRATSVVAQLRAYAEEPQHILESYAVDFDTLKPVLRLLKDLGRSLLENNWLELVTLGDELSRAKRRAEIVFLDSLIEGPALPQLADWALCWLMADPLRARLRLRRSSGELMAGRLLAHFAPVCSDVTYLCLEQWLLSYVEPDLLDSYKRRHEWIGQGGNIGEPSSFGRTPHALLPRLPAERRSVEVNSRIEELNRKFPSQISSDDEGGDDLRVGYLGSPLSEDSRARMSDEDWLAIAANEKLPARFGNPRFKKGGLVEAASVETFAVEFQNMTQKQPERFARLTLRLSTAASPAFLNAILSGLAWPGDRRPQDEGWMPPSHEVLEEVLALPAVQALARSEDRQAASSICRILKRYAEYPWSESSIELLVWITRHHSDPEPDSYSPDEDPEHFDRLESHALNVTRGAAGFAIHSLLFAQPALFTNLRPLSKSLIRDEYPAVRVAALAACLPVIKIDPDLAVSWFMQACEGPDALLATSEAKFVFRYTHLTHLDRIRPLIERMVACPLPRVATARSFPGGGVPLWSMGTPAALPQRHSAPAQGCRSGGCLAAWRGRVRREGKADLAKPGGR